MFSCVYSNVLRYAMISARCCSFFSPEKEQQREGYLAWRRDQGRNHADRVAGLMRDVGYTRDDCDRVAVIIRKQDIKRDAEVQVLEDVAASVGESMTWSRFRPDGIRPEALPLCSKSF